MSDLHKKLVLGKSGGLPPRPNLGTSSDKSEDSAQKRAIKNKRDYTPLPWSDYYDRVEDVLTNEKKNTFRVYIKGDSGPVFFFLHGGGFSGLSWALLSSILIGKIQCQCYSMDIRGHGRF